MFTTFKAFLEAIFVPPLKLSLAIPNMGPFNPLFFPRWRGKITEEGCREGKGKDEGGVQQR